MKIIDVARQLKVTRKTIWMWRKQTEFETYQERLRRDWEYEVAVRRRHLEGKTVDALLNALEEGDPRVAVNVAKLLWGN
jgi:hypothetical protein